MKACFVLPAALLWICSGVLSAQEAPPDTSRISAILYHAQNEGIEDELFDQPELKESLVKLFGYRAYRKLGEDRAGLNPDAATILRPNPMFTFTVTPREAPAYGWELAQEEKSVADGAFVPKPAIPLIIKGPQFDVGVIVIVVRVGK